MGSLCSRHSQVLCGYLGEYTCLLYTSFDVVTSSPSFVCVSCGELVRGKIEFRSTALLLSSHKGAPKCQSQFTWEKVVNSFAVTDDLIVVCERTDCGYMTCVSRGWHSDPKDGSATPPPPTHGGCFLRGWTAWPKHQVSFVCYLFCIYVLLPGIQ